MKGPIRLAHPKENNELGYHLRSFGNAPAPERRTR